MSSGFLHASRYTKTLMVVVCMLIAGATAIALNSMLVCNAAKTVFARFKAITPGVSTTADLDDLVRDGTLEKDKNCSEVECIYNSTITNRWLWHLHVATPMGLITNVFVEHGVVQRAQSSLMGEYARPGISVEKVRCSSCIRTNAQDREESATRKRAPGHERFVTSFNNGIEFVIIARDATPEEKSKAFDINLGVLCKLGKTSGRDLSSTLWEGQPPEW